MNQKIELFIASDVHGKFDELWSYVQDQGFNPDNINHLFIMNGDILDYEDDEIKISKDIEKIIKLMQTHKNIVFLKGNHEDKIRVFDTKISNFLSRLPIVYHNDNIWVCHGWFNPKWTVSEHADKTMRDRMPVADSGSIIHGSPQNIFVRNKEGLDYFKFKTIDEYERTLIDKYPQYTFVFGHYSSFFWMYEKCKKIHYTTYKEELKKLKSGKSNFISEMASEFDYSKPYISPNNKIYCIDVYTKCHKYGLKYYFHVQKFISSKKGVTLDEDGNISYQL